MSAAPVPAPAGALTAPQPAQHRTETPAAARFAIGDDDFLLDGAPFRILSGALHYFRVHPRQWADRIADAGMYAIVRPGPYICAEWTNGGLPAWLFRTGTTGVRRDEPAFMAAVR